MLGRAQAIKSEPGHALAWAVNNYRKVTLVQTIDVQHPQLICQVFSVNDKGYLSLTWCLLLTPNELAEKIANKPPRTEFKVTGAVLQTGAVISGSSNLLTETSEWKTGSDATGPYEWATVKVIASFAPIDDISFTFEGYAITRGAV